VRRGGVVGRGEGNIRNNLRRVTKNTGRAQESREDVRYKGDSWRGNSKHCASNDEGTTGWGYL